MPGLGLLGTTGEQVASTRLSPEIVALTEEQVRELRLYVARLDMLEVVIWGGLGVVFPH